MQRQEANPGIPFFGSDFAITDEIPHIVFVAGPDGAIEYVNKFCLDFTGLRPGEANGRGWERAIHPDDRPETSAAWARSVRTGEPFEFEYRLRRRDGTYRWHLGRAHPHRGEDGSITRWFGTCTDINDFKTSGEAAKAAAGDQALLASIVHSAGDAIVSMDPDGNILTWNPSAERLFGYTAKEVIGRPITILTPSEFRAMALDVVERCERGEYVPPYETLRVRKGGQRVDVSVTPSAVWSADGKVIALIAIYRDVTDRKRVELELQEARAAAERGLARMKAVVSSMSDGLIVATPDGALIDWNPAALRMHGYSSIDEVRMNLTQFNSTFVLTPSGGQPLPFDQWPMRRVLRGEVLSEYELNVRRLDTGLELVVRYSGGPVYGPDGRVELGVLTLHDASVRRRLEEQFRQAQKMEAIGRLAGGVAHDFNNLLTVINGYGELLLNTIEPKEPSWEMVDEMKKAGERAAALTRQLLAFSRQQVLQPRILNLNAVLTELKKFLKRVVGENIKVIDDLEPSVWPIRADPGQVEQVVMNLVVNARDAMPEGGFVRIGTRNVEIDESSVPARPGVKPGRYVLMHIRDTGTGIPEKIRARIFEPFFTTKGPGEGTGLGLSVVHGVVEQTGGFVEVESAPGMGTTFRVYLPADCSQTANDHPKAGMHKLVRGSETVLVVEDEPAVRALAVRVLKAAGYTVLEAGGATEALGVAGRHKAAIHLLLTDVVMPGLGGRTIAEILQHEYPGLRVLFMSGYTTDTVVRHGVRQESVSFLQKPFAPIALAAKVREVLDAPAVEGPQRG